MITPAYAQGMAAYNRWQNTKLLAAAGSLSDEERRADRGAFFGTLNHLLWGDELAPLNETRSKHHGAAAA